MKEIEPHYMQENENAPQGEREQIDTFTLRLSKGINDRIRTMAYEIGISQNALIRTFIFLELKRFDEVTPFQQEELRHFLSQIPK